MTAATLYDRIAAFYDDDMGRNMRFDDVGFYLSLARREAGPVLEIGVGTGRIAGALAGAGIEVFGIDRSRPMLAALQQRHPLACAQADMRALPLASGRFGLVLFPYSVLCYLGDAAGVDAALAEAARVARPGALLVLDAFVPRPVAPGERVDYVRQTAAGRLERRRRVEPLADGRHRVMRRYRLQRADGAVEQVDTEATIRPLGAEALRAAVDAIGGRIEAEVPDYGAGVQAAQFLTVLARLPGR